MAFTRLLFGYTNYKALTSIKYENLIVIEDFNIENKTWKRSGNPERVL